MRVSSALTILGAIIGKEGLEYGNALMQHLPKDLSDHATFLMTASTRLDSMSKPFRFLKVWTTKAGLLDVIRDGWSCEMVYPPLCMLAVKATYNQAGTKGMVQGVIWRHLQGC